MALLTYNEVRPWARSIARALENRDMPTWDGGPGYGPWKNDISPREDLIAAILRWISSGAARGEGEEPAFQSPERSGTAFTDRTRIGIWFAEPEELEKELVNLWIMNSAFTIPPATRTTRPAPTTSSPRMSSSVPWRRTCTTAART